MFTLRAKAVLLALWGLGAALAMQLGRVPQAPAAATQKAAIALILALALVLSGCRVDVGGMCGAYPSDDIEYFPPSPEFMDSTAPAELAVPAAK